MAENLVNRVLFIGGPGNFASVRIRCEQIATHLGADYRTDVSSLDAIPAEYSTFVCVKPALTSADLLALSNRGKVIWDIHDAAPPPPETGISLYLTSTRSAREAFPGLRVKVIPHHHCNLDGPPNFGELRRPGWIGKPYWRPVLHGFDYDTHDSRRRTRDEIVQCYRRVGIGLNLRSLQPDSSFHIKINPGVKLLNFIGFGIPSVSALEPAYLEQGDGCTIFSTVDQCAEAVRRLQDDHKLYARLRDTCLATAPAFHISAIAERYRSLLNNL